MLVELAYIFHYKSIYSYKNRDCQERKFCLLKSKIKQDNGTKGGSYTGEHGISLSSRRNTEKLYKVYRISEIGVLTET